MKLLCCGVLFALPIFLLPHLADGRGSVGRIEKSCRFDDQALGYISLAHAAEGGEMAVMKAWLARGIDPNGAGISSESGELGELAEMMDAPIALAARNGHFDAVTLLLGSGARPDKCCCSCTTALHYAIRGKHVEVVKALLDAGASPYRLFDGKTSPLDLAIQSGVPQIKTYIEAQMKKMPPRSGTGAGKK